MKKILSIRLLLLLIFVGTIIILIVNPRQWVEKGKLLNYSYCSIIGAECFAIQSLKKSSLFVSIKRNDNRTVVNKYHINEGLEMQSNLTGYSCMSIVGEVSTNCMFDVERNITYSVLNSNSSQYILLETPVDSKKSLVMHNLFNHEVFHSLQDTMITIKRYNLLAPRVLSQDDSLIYFEEYRNSLRLVSNDDNLSRISRSIFNTPSISDFQNKLPQNLTIDDVSNYLNETLRNSHYKKRIFTRDNYKDFGFLVPRLKGFINADNDAEKELLIYIIGQRWIKGQLICYDPIEKVTKWRKEFNPDLYCFTIVDIDSDGVEEILFSSYASCNQQDWIQDNETSKLDKFHSYFTVLDNHGNFKKINGKEVIIKARQGFFMWTYHFLEGSNKILLGLSSPVSKISQKIMCYDLKTNKLTETEIECNDVVGISTNKNGTFVINSKKNMIEKIDITKDFEVKRRISRKTEFSPSSKNLLDQTTLLGNEYIVTQSPYSLWDNNLNEVFVSEYNMAYPQWLGDELYFCDWGNPKDRTLSKLTFTRNTTPNPWVILILFFELSLLITAYSFHFFVSVPLHSTQKSYLVLYSFLGKLHHWKIFGQLSKIHALPKNFSIHSKDFDIALSELTENQNEIYSRNLGFLNLKAYELKNWDEFQIIQRIAHDMKNKVLSMKMFSLRLKAANQDNNEIYEITEQIDENINDVSEMALTLSKLSHINKIYPESSDLNEIIRELLLEYSNHPLYSQINIKNNNEEKNKKDIYTKIDKNMFKSAIKNLINNALEEIGQNEKIILSLSSDSGIVTLRIENPGQLNTDRLKDIQQIGYTTKSKGSGIGIPIAKMIVEKHKGKFAMKCENGIVIVEIRLRKVIQSF